MKKFVLKKGKGKESAHLALGLKCADGDREMLAQIGDGDFKWVGTGKYSRDYVNRLDDEIIRTLGDVNKYNSHGACVYIFPTASHLVRWASRADEKR